MITPIIVFIVLGITSAFAIASVKRIPEGHAYTLRRVGGHVRTVGAGMHFVMPLLERVAHRIRLLGNVVTLKVPSSGDAPHYAGQVFYQVLDAERADAVIDDVDAYVCASLPALLQAAADEDGAERNRRVKRALNAHFSDRGILVTRVQIAVA